MEAYPNWQRTHVQTVCVESSNLFASTKMDFRGLAKLANATDLSKKMSAIQK